MKALTMLFVFFALLGMNNAQSAPATQEVVSGGGISIKKLSSMGNTLVLEATGTCEAKCACKCPEQLVKPKKKKVKKKPLQWASDGVKTVEVCKDPNHIQTASNGQIKCAKF